MKTLRPTLITAVALSLAMNPRGLHAASLKEAQFTRVINDVRVMPVESSPFAAKIGDRITGKTGVSTGAHSRAELQFPDRTLTRIGSNSVFKLDQAERTVNLEKGVILLQVPKQLGGAKVRTAAVTAAVTGTSVIIEFLANFFIKMIVIEGVVEAYFNDNPSVFITLNPGDMIIMNPNATEFPPPVQVDLQRLKETSKLLDEKEFGPPGNLKHIQDALQDQGEKKNDGELLKTAFVIPGRGTMVTFTNEARQEIFKNLFIRNLQAGGQDKQGNGQGQNNNNNGNANGGGGENQGGTGGPPSGAQFQHGINSPIFHPGATIIDNASSISTNPHLHAYNSVPNDYTTMDGTTYYPFLDGPVNTHLFGDPQTYAKMDELLAGRLSWFVFLGEDVYLSGNPFVDTSHGPRNLLIAGKNSITLTSDPFGGYEGGFFGPVGLATGPEWILGSNIDALALVSRDGPIFHDSTFSLRGDAQQVAYYAYGSDSDIEIYGNYTASLPSIDFPNGSFNAHAGRDIYLGDAQISAGEVKMHADRDISIDYYSRIKAKTKLHLEALGNINIQNSSQLLALTTGDPLEVLIEAINGNVNIDSSFIEARSIEIMSRNGGIAINNSSIFADIIKAGVFSPAGELLIGNNTVLGNPSIPASLIKLYGEGSAGVRFTGVTTINGHSVHIAGPSVTIDSGGQVKLSNAPGTTVYTNSPNYNNGSHGNFTDLGGVPQSVNTHPGGFSARPPFK